MEQLDMQSFDGFVTSNGEDVPCKMTVSEPEIVHDDLYACDVSTTFPRAIRTRLFGPSAAGAHKSALAFLRSLIGPAAFTDREGKPADPFSGPASPMPTIEELGGGWNASDGITLSLHGPTDGKYALQADQVVRDSKEKTNWSITQIVSVKQLDVADVDSMSLSQEILADIGFNVLLMLVGKRKVGH
jgi:hypothetical protein